MMISTSAYSTSDLCASRPRTAKHLTERKRRARINDSLLQLKSMVFPAVRKDISRHPKMEKADILEMTVRYLKDVQTQPKEGGQAVTGVTQYHAGFTECLSEVSNFMSTCENIDIETRLRLLGHLADRCSTINEPDQKPDILQQQRVEATPSPVPSPSPVPQQPQHQHPQGMVILVPAQTMQTLPTATPVISVRVPCNDNLLTPPQSPISTEATAATSIGATRLTPSPVDIKPSRHAIDRHNQRFSPYQKPKQHLLKAASKPMWRPW